MDDVLDEVVSSEDLEKFEKVFHEQLHQRNVTHKAQFEYAWCLVRSKYATDIRKGILLLKELFNSHAEGKRDYLFYLAIGNARIKEYNKALHYIKRFLEIEPTNQQVLALERQINKRMETEGLVGMAVAGGAVLALGGLVGLGIALASRK
ncbi:mitochondrial fission 1 protein [Danaus plexippus]|uniref:mitochondrial fission 1 protein n=1 Tax=Danaus plexippus TaxID=13037 RepID=UPI002AB02765|nr:mitochondrial fission 1 protein [Danaus plexippus]